MNILTINGSTKKKRELVESAMIHCINELMPRMRTLEIELNLKSLKKDKVFGWCYEGENNRDYYIDIEKSLVGDELIETVCHEMVHVWQSATRKMKDLSFGAKLYMGEIYDSTVAYNDEPWEIEAYEMQGKLLETFKDEYVV